MLGSYQEAIELIIPDWPDTVILDYPEVNVDCPLTAIPNIIGDVTDPSITFDIAGSDDK